MDIDFECVQCGKCCHGLKLPLTLSEAVSWLADGHQVQVICQALPWESEPLPADLTAAHKRRRSFAARSGSMAIRVDVILAATFAGACPHLQPDMHCGIYLRRPLVCRVYPAEINPFIALQPADKVCPAPAWAAGRPPLIRGGVLVDAGTRAIAQASRNSDAAEVGAKEAVCAALGLNVASLSGEGLVIHSPGRLPLLDALRHCRSATPGPCGDTAWHIATNQHTTGDDLRSRGAASAWAGRDVAPPYEYLGFQSEAEPEREAADGSTGRATEACIPPGQPGHRGA